MSLRWPSNQLQYRPNHRLGISKKRGNLWSKRTLSSCSKSKSGYIVLKTELFLKYWSRKTTRKTRIYTANLSISDTAKYSELCLLFVSSFEHISWPAVVVCFIVGWWLPTVSPWRIRSVFVHYSAATLSKVRGWIKPNFTNGFSCAQAFNLKIKTIVY